ncbi:helix-turn-helix transcriptional regulator [Isoptericola sp. NEAU-Y5]|uniref:Helix-turn-helix transcriptional regulator n=1 Tax=Isoptericola luteus TaxID=2879484 RepID=A0ABS7ZBJ6_9MICO|nr:helix-turn-helix domain-containing protein [Isoptericola sp. NEAU-Y5]MCA5892273.1 helix-turn-helix transcriptional regulator [Isoptericola sp. NEAU-Y5]
MEIRYGCPVEVTLGVIGGAWSVVILAHLKEGPRRYGELRRLVTGISEKMLTQQLRHLVTVDLVVRRPLGGNPPAVEYTLTDDGRRLGPALQALHDWGADRAERDGLVVTSMSPR